jgi:hypothetical protein
MKKIVFSIALVATLFANAYGQDLNCTQRLRTARVTYEQGRLHEVPTLLEGDCFTEKRGSFSQTEKIEAYKLLVLTYIYLEEPAKADEAMKRLLETDHFFKINPLVDPVEFQRLYEKFRTWPIFSYGIKFGPNTNSANVQKNYYIWGGSEGKGSYKANVGIQFGLVFEKNINDNFIANPEIFYNSYSFSYVNPAISTVDEAGEERIDNANFEIKQNRLNLNLMVQYRIAKNKFNKNLTPYVALGPSIYYLLGSTFGGDVTVTSQKTITAFDTQENYKKIGLGVTASAGIKYKVGSFYITADIRYTRGLNNIVKSSNRFKQTQTNQQLWDAGYMDNDFTISQSMLNLGVIVPHFKPKKLIK